MLNLQATPVRTRVGPAFLLSCRTTNASCHPDCRGCGRVRREVPAYGLTRRVWRASRDRERSIQLAVLFLYPTRALCADRFFLNRQRRCNPVYCEGKDGAACHRSVFDIHSHHFHAHTMLCCQLRPTLRTARASVRPSLFLSYHIAVSKHMSPAHVRSCQSHVYAARLTLRLLHFSTPSLNFAQRVTATTHEHGIRVTVHSAINHHKLNICHAQSPRARTLLRCSSGWLRLAAQDSAFVRAGAVLKIVGDAATAW